MRSIEEQMSVIRRRSSLYRERKETRLLSLAATGVGALLLMVMILAPGVKGTMDFGGSHLGATILEPEAGGYVIVALLSFTLGVIITLITQKYRKTGKALKKTAPLFFITFLSSLFLISGSAYAGEETVYDITKGSITVTADSADGSRHKVKQGENEETVEGILVISGNKAKYTLNTITVDAGGKKADIVIRSVFINALSNTAALKTEGTGDIDIELDGENTLKSEMNCAGLQKENTGVLTIKDENSEEGLVTAAGGADGAGIGGGYLGAGNNITITGGTVTATGGYFGAGIGGGMDGAGENITISGGTVTAIGDGGGAGIGGGNNGAGENITISGGTVTATGGSDGAGIGGGQNGSGNSINIFGGTVTATGGVHGAGIGGGQTGAGENITISGGTVTAIGDGGGAGIGGGTQRNGSSITISGGKVTAQGGARGTYESPIYGYGIGDGYNAPSMDNNITIRGWATVNAIAFDEYKMISGFDSNYYASVLYNTGKITTYKRSILPDSTNNILFITSNQNLLSTCEGTGTPPQTKVRFCSVPEGAVTNFHSDSDLHKAGTAISMNALEYNSDKYRLLGLSITSGTGILTKKKNGYELVVGEAERGKDSIVVTARFAALSSSADPVKKETPAAVFTAAGADSGTLSGLISGESYDLTGAATSTFTASGTSRSIAGVSPGTLSIVRKRDGSGAADSDPQEISISRAETPTGINKTDCTSSSGDDGKITGVTEAMEYRKSDASTWTQVITGTELTGLTPGTYYVRIKAAATALASEKVTLVVKAYAAPGQVQAPLFDPPAGTYEGEQNISITCETPDAVIYYTVDGSDPTTSSTGYSKPISVTEDMTIKAFAVKDGMTDSAVSTAVYTIGEEPVITKYLVTVNNGTGGGEYAENETVTIKANDPQEGKVFDKWTSEDGVTFVDPASPETTFKMPGKAVTVSAAYKDKGKKEDEPDPEKPAQEKTPDKVPLTDPSSSYASPEDNFAPVAPGSSEGTGGSIKKLELDFSMVKGSGVAADDLKMTAIAGSKFITKEKVKDKNSVKTEGGVKAKFNKKNSTVTITCKNSGKAIFNMENGDSYTVNFTVEKPKPNKNEARISAGTAPVTKTVKDLFGTSINGGKLTILKEKLSGQATLNGSGLTINPAEKDTIKVQYQYLNKKYKLSIKVK